MFTDISKKGRHANEGNESSVGIEMVGRYNNKLPSGVIWNNVKVVLKLLLQKFNLTLEDIHFHREYNPTKDCPGEAITKDWVKEQLNTEEDD